MSQNSQKTLAQQQIFKSKLDPPKKLFILMSVSQNLIKEIT